MTTIRLRGKDEQPTPSQRLQSILRSTQKLMRLIENHPEAEMEDLLISELKDVDDNLDDICTYYEENPLESEE